MTYSDYRRVARENLRGNYWQSVFVGFVAAFLGGLLFGSSGFNFNVDSEILAELPLILVSYITLLASISGLLGFVAFIIGGTIELGYAQYLLNQYDHRHFDIHDLFSQFDRFSVGFLQNLLRGIYIALWSLLLVIPGIVKTYAYAMTPFILAENPNLTANEAITASKELMDGHKGELFMLDLTFIGWDLLAILTLNIGGFFLSPYRHAAHTAFYRDLVAAKVTVDATAETSVES